MTGRPGRREREAGKRHRRAVTVEYRGGAAAVTLKLGRKHLRRHLSRILRSGRCRKAGGARALVHRP